MRHAYSNADSVAKRYCYCYCNTYGYSYSHAYGNANFYVVTSAKPDTYRHLYGGLHDGYYHWHGQCRRHRYRQPLRRLHNGHHSTLPGKRIRQSTGYSGGCGVGRRHTLPRALQQTVLVDGVRAGGSGDWAGSVPEYLVP
jgi:hypothetical protein